VKVVASGESGTPKAADAAAQGVPKAEDPNKK